MKFFTVEKIAKQLPDLQAAIHREAHPIPRFKCHLGDVPDAARPDFDDSGWDDFEVGSQWGGYDTIAWFRARVPVPAHLRGRKLALRFLAGPRDGGKSTAEAMLYAGGLPLQAIDVWHEVAWLPPELLQADDVSIALRAWSGVYGPPPTRHFKLALLLWIDETAEAFYYLADTVLKALRALDENDLRRERMLAALNNAFLHIDWNEPRSEHFYASLAAAHASLREHVCAWESLEEIKPAVMAVGHAHIDLAWLWRKHHSREKAARTFATALHLMRQYPEYRFTHSSPQLYQAIKREQPDLFARIKERIAAGQWEITGGMWVESDTNLPSGESLVRQFLLGRQFIRQEFGRETTVLWLPDVFGYSAALPQIALKAGMQAFMTTKISWNQTNRFPHDTFRWRGIDGSELLTHFVTTPDPASWYQTYNGRLEPRDVKGMWDRYRQKELNAELLHLYGWGDGGGGPTQEMIESGLALRNLPGLPRVEFGCAEPYFERLCQRLQGQDVPVWDGELYLEYHRGTYTSQAANKRANRQAEALYHTAEWLSALASVLTARSTYPAAELRAGWEDLLFNQFHDILPGSSIPAVYEDTRADYARILALGQGVLDRAQRAILDGVAAPEPSVVVFNPLGWARAGVVTLPWSAELDGAALAGSGDAAGLAQVAEVDGARVVLLEAPAVSALGYRVCPRRPAGGQPAAHGALTITPRQLENSSYRITLDEHGHITSLFDKRYSREVLAAGARANVLQAFEDRPMNFDAWDIDLYYQEKMQVVDDLVDAVVEEAGPLRGTLRLTWRFHQSLITQRLSLYAHSDRIDFRTEVDWRQQQVLLKVAFPVLIRARHATYDIQFGALERPTHWNTSWDWARFEAPGHKWVDLSEGGYGVAVLNDCKYGHDVHDNVLRLTLIKSPIDPDPQADQGRHTFTYALLPHAGDWRTGGVIEAAYDLNYPLLAAPASANPGGQLPAEFSFVACDDPNVVIETVKQAEEGGGWVVRVYESRQTRSSAVRLEFGRPVERAVECNLVEEEERPVSVAGRRLTFAIAPFEIKTFHVWLG